MTQPLPWEKNTAALVPPAPEPVPIWAPPPAPKGAPKQKSLRDIFKGVTF